MPGARGRSGRKPKPTALKVIEGNRGKRPLNKAEPKPTGGAPTCPSWLSSEAKAEWHRVVPELERLKMLTLVDRAALAAYCEAWSLLREAQDEIERNGLVLIEVERELDDGRMLVCRAGRNPAATVMNQAMATIRGFCAEFGLTPSARSRMTTGSHGEQTNPRERLLS